MQLSKYSQDMASGFAVQISLGSFWHNFGYGGDSLVSGMYFLPKYTVIDDKCIFKHCHTMWYKDIECIYVTMIRQSDCSTKILVLGKKEE